MKGRFASSIGAIVCLVLTGCLGDVEDDPGEAVDRLWAARALPFGDDHDHYDVTQHQGLSTPNFELLGHNGLVSPHLGRTASGGLCADAGDRGERRIGVVHSISDEVAFTLVDVTDATDPTPIGEFVLPNSGSRDVALSEDGRFVAMGVSSPSTDPALPLVQAPSFRRACDGVERSLLTPTEPGPLEYLPYPPGVMLVSIEEPEAPVLVDHYPLPVLGGHSVTSGTWGDKQIIVASVVNLATAASNFWFFTIDETPAGERLVPLAIFQDSATAGNAPLLNGHNDAWVQDHPITGAPLAYLANWNQGMAILDMSDPTTPQVIGRWSDNPGPNADLQSDGTGSVHEAFPMRETTADGRHYTFIGQEILGHPAATPSGWVRVLDTTDPTDPHVVAEWTLPTEVVWSEQLVFSTHYVDYWEDTLFVAHYHAGVWAIDLSGLPDTPFPPAVGVFVPANSSPAPPQDASYDWSPTIMDANVLSNGDLVVWDSASGVYVVRFHADDPAPPLVWHDYAS